MKTLALAAIAIYQRFISPYKGFRCAYAALTGCRSCSQLGARAIRRYGLWDGLRVLDGRLHKCGVAYRRYHVPAPGPMLRSQAGFLDCACDGPGNCNPCDGDGGNANRGGVTSGLCNCVGDCASCDFGREKKRRRDRDIVIPPRR